MSHRLLALTLTCLLGAGFATSDAAEKKRKRRNPAVRNC